MNTNTQECNPGIWSPNFDASMIGHMPSQMEHHTCNRCKHEMVMEEQVLHMGEGMHPSGNDTVSKTTGASGSAGGMNMQGDPGARRF